MGVYIKGMEMPTNCWEDDCPCLNKQYGFCQADDDKGFVYSNKPEWCPLVPVPPHGRLIEDVAVREQIEEWLDSVGDVVVGRGLSYYGELLGCIEDAPTIIEAEEGE